MRTACWLFSVSLTFGTSYFGYGIFRDVKNHQLPANEHLKVVLGDTLAVAPVQAECLVYGEVQRTWREHNWTGAPPPPPTSCPPFPTEPQFVSVLTMLRMTMVQVDGAADAEESCIYVDYIDSRVAPEAVDRLFIGDALAAPFGGTSVVSITQQGVEFAHAEFSDENEVIRHADLNEVPLIFIVGPDGARIPRPAEIPLAPPMILRPKQTQQRSKNHFQVGTEDALYLAADYPEILTNNLRYRTHRDPKTGKRRGIEIEEVRAGSVAERHGLRGGDIIHSVNDHQVTGVQGTISYFKTNSDRFTTWRVVMETLGRRRTVTYESPGH